MRFSLRWRELLVELFGQLCADHSRSRTYPHLHYSRINPINVHRMSYDARQTTFRHKPCQFLLQSIANSKTMARGKPMQHQFLDVQLYRECR